MFGGPGGCNYKVQGLKHYEQIKPDGDPFGNIRDFLLPLLVLLLPLPLPPLPLLWMEEILLHLGPTKRCNGNGESIVGEESPFTMLPPPAPPPPTLDLEHQHPESLKRGYFPYPQSHHNLHSFYTDLASGLPARESLLCRVLFKRGYTAVIYWSYEP